MRCLNSKTLQRGSRNLILTSCKSYYWYGLRL